MIVVPIVAKNSSEAIRQIGKANGKADGIELRLDYFSRLGEAELKRLIHACKKPCICTCRSAAEGGNFVGSEATALQVLMGAIKHGCHFVDLEFGVKPALRKKLMDYAKKHGAKVILSRHFVSHTPTKKELSALLKKMAKEKAHVVKIVTKAAKKEDGTVVLELFKDAKRHKVELSAFGMGEQGKDSRVLSKLLGGFASFASLEKGLESAQGQLTLDEFRKIESEMRALLT